MAFLFGRSKPRANTFELPKQVKELLSKIDTPTSKNDELAKLLLQCKHVLQGSPEIESGPDQQNQLVNSIISEDLLHHLAINLHKLSFESRKDAQSIFSYTLRFRPPGANLRTDPIALSWVVNNRPQFLIELCNCYGHKESAIPAGTVLREILKSDAATAIILYDDDSENGSQAKPLGEINPAHAQSGKGIFWKFFTWIDQGSFELSADAFQSFRELLTKHKNIVAQYLQANFDMFFEKYNTILLGSESYVTKRQSIKLLGEILLDRANYTVMTAYVDRGPHLKICMNLLRDERRMVAYEGFHVFKVFVANPHKSIAVQKILINNRERLLRFLPEFLSERTEDEQFIDEREFLIRQIKALPPQPVEPVQKPTLQTQQSSGA